MFLASTSEKVTRDAPNNAAPGIRKRCSAPRARRDMWGNQSDKTDDSGKAYSPRRHERSGQNPADTQTPHIDAQRRSGFFTGKQRIEIP